MPAPSSKFYGKIWVGFCLNTGKLFFLEVSFWSQQKEHRFFSKTVLGIFKIALSLKDRHVFMWQSVKILNFFNGLTLKQLFCKTKTFFKKLGYCFSFESTKFENASFPCKTGISEGNVNTNKMVTTKWTYRKERSFASNYFIIIIIIVFFLEILFQQSWFVVPTTKMTIFVLSVSAGVSFDGAFPSWVSLIASVYFSICFIYLFKYTSGGRSFLPESTLPGEGYS